MARVFAMFSRLTFKSDRRRRTRQMLNTSVRVFTSDGTIEALGVNISDVGMCLFTVANLLVGSEIKLEFPSEGAGTTVILATVRYRALYLYGVEFHPDSRENSDHSSAEIKPVPCSSNSLTD